MSVTEVAKLLQQIADNTAHNNSMWFAVIAGGLFGAGLTAFFCYFIFTKTMRTEERRLRADLVTTERLRWLHDLRQKFAHLYALSDAHRHLLEQKVPAGEIGKHAEALATHFNQINEEAGMLTTMLSPRKQYQANLKSGLKAMVVLLDESTTAAKSGTASFDTKRYNEIKESAFEAIGLIGADTWEQVKELK